jgi:altronate dehydratase large subunit
MGPHSQCEQRSSAYTGIKGGGDYALTEFMGYERPDGQVGIRNHLLVIAPIDCSYEPAKKIADQVEGAVAVTQTYGCGNDSMLVHNLVGTALNPNVAGVLIVGLGCETLTG